MEENKVEIVGQWTSYLHTIVGPHGGGTVVVVVGVGGGGEAAILAAIANLSGRFDGLEENFHGLAESFHGLEGRFDDLVEEVRVTNRTTAILANNNSLVRYDLFEYVKLSLCSVTSWLENLCRLLFFLIIIKAAGRGPLIPIRNALNIYPANANPPVEFPASVLDLNSIV